MSDFVPKLSNAQSVYDGRTKQMSLLVLGAGNKWNGELEARTAHFANSNGDLTRPENNLAIMVARFLKPGPELPPGTVFISGALLQC